MLIQAAKRNQEWGELLARARWKSQQEDRWQPQRGPANGNRQVPWQTDRTQWHGSWAAKPRKVSQNKKRTCLPHTHQGDLATLCQGPVGEAGPQRWTHDSRTRTTVPEKFLYFLLLRVIILRLQKFLVSRLRKILHAGLRSWPFIQRQWQSLKGFDVIRRII